MWSAIREIGQTQGMTSGWLVVLVETDVKMDRSYSQPGRDWYLFRYRTSLKGYTHEAPRPSGSYQLCNNCGGTNIMAEATLGAF